ncbi:MAG: 5-formyltetrahydrofolate cyclo-ligase [Sporichthyaceae bacterium]
MVDADRLGIEPDVDAAKRELRAAALTRRAARTSDASPAICQVALTEALPPTVAAYVSLPGEPGTADLLAALIEAGHRVLLPILRPDLDLEWAEHTGSLRAGLRGTLEPAGPSLGVESIAEAGAILVPGLLAGRDGTRLGRGGGSYDRALARRSPGSLVAMLCWPEEIVETLPTLPHDARIDAALTPDGLVRLGGAP